MVWSVQTAKCLQAVMDHFETVINTIEVRISVWICLPSNPWTMKLQFTEDFHMTYMFYTFRYCSCDINWRRASVTSSCVVGIDMISRWNCLFKAFSKFQIICTHLKLQHRYLLSTVLSLHFSLKMRHGHLSFRSFQTIKCNDEFLFKGWTTHDIFWLKVIIRRCWAKIVEWKTWDVCWHFQNVTHRLFSNLKFDFIF